MSNFNKEISNDLGNSIHQQDRVLDDYKASIIDLVQINENLLERVVDLEHMVELLVENSSINHQIKRNRLSSLMSYKLNSKDREIMLKQLRSAQVTGVLLDVKKRMKMKKS